MTVVLLTSDLMVVSRVDGAAARAAAAMRTAGDVSQAVQHCAQEQATLLIVDLSLPSLDIAALIQQLRAAMNGLPRIVAFGPHVHEERLAAARRAGCGEVVSRGEFFARLDTML
jgi:DNA-binding response OmpR family regulator